MVPMSVFLSPVSRLTRQGAEVSSDPLGHLLTRLGKKGSSCKSKVSFVSPIVPCSEFGMIKKETGDRARAEEGEMKEGELCGESKKFWIPRTFPPRIRFGKREGGKSVTNVLCVIPE